MKAAWEDHDAGRLGDDALAQRTTEAVREVLAEQQSRAILPMTDGEFWRRGFQETFASSVSGYRPPPDPFGGASREQRRQIPESEYVRRQGAIARLRLDHNVLLEEYQRDVALSQGPIKVTLTGPERITQRFDLEHSGELYASFDSFMDDVVAIEREILTQVIGAGCPYIQIDEPAYTAYVDGASLSWMRERNWDPVRGLSRAIAADNALIEGFPSTTFGLHICRGNAGGSWHREGSYDAIAEHLFSELAYDRLLLEYDTERAGSFAPLRFVPKGKVAVLGLLSTKTGVLEDEDELLRRIDEASSYLPLTQLAISPQCGFSSGLAGNPLTLEEQWRKLERVRDVAARVWS